MNHETVSSVHDGVVHHPLGGASHYFGRNLVKYVNERCDQPNIGIHIGTQPNSSPHLGNIVTFATAFVLATALQHQHSRNIVVTLVYVDTAPAVGQNVLLDNIQYQKTLKDTGQLHAKQPHFELLLTRLSKLSGISFRTRDQSFWRSRQTFIAILRDIINRRDTLGRQISPSTGKLAIRAPCPTESCGLCDKHGIQNIYEGDTIIFTCPHHGQYSININEASQTQGLGFNTPLRNLIRALSCARDEDTSWVLVTGADYAGFYQDQLLWRLLDEPATIPIIIYAPLVIDWSGSKLSKSLYVRNGAYRYLVASGMEYMVDFVLLMSLKFSIEAIYQEVNSWIVEPYKLFRAYSMDYWHAQLVARGMSLPKERPTSAGIPCQLNSSSVDDSIHPPSATWANELNTNSIGQRPQDPSSSVPNPHEKGPEGRK